MAGKIRYIDTPKKIYRANRLNRAYYKRARRSYKKSTLYKQNAQK